MEQLMADPASTPTLLITGKWLLGVMTAVFGFLFAWIFSKQNNTYTKEETEKLIDLKLTPLIQSLDKHATYTFKQTETMSELNRNIQTLNTSIAVVSTRMDSFERQDNKE